MSKTIVINPLTRISGFLEIKVEVDNEKVIDAYSSGMFYRGFEQMLPGRNPLDAIYFTERICGICSAAHSMASVSALEDAMGIEISEGAKILRNLIHGCEFLQNHIRHFYLFTIPDFVRISHMEHLSGGNHNDYRLPEEINRKMEQNYFKSIEFSSMCHELLTLFGGKAPHNHGIAVGGVSVEATSDNIVKFKSILQLVIAFINEQMVPDVYSIAKYYDDYFHIGKGPENFLSYGVFDNISGEDAYVEPKAYVDGNYEEFNRDSIKETIEYSWYNSSLLPEPCKENAYSWVKAPRYNGKAVEVGPLSRLWLSGRYTNGVSAMDRTIARVLEVKIIADMMRRWIDLIVPGIYMLSCPGIPNSSKGFGFIDTTRGTLMHSISIKDRKIDSYNIITPTAWNCSPRDSQRIPGAIEQALVGTPVLNPDFPVEIGRVVRSFDPCISCAVHIYRPNKNIERYEIL